MSFEGSTGDELSEELFLDTLLMVTSIIDTYGNLDITTYGRGFGSDNDYFPEVTSEEYLALS